MWVRKGLGSFAAISTLKMQLVFKIANITHSANPVHPGIKGGVPVRGKLKILSLPDKVVLQSVFAVSLTGST